ncbi:MAG TPA: hypothetical protein VIV12_05795, partial [Streptosporangiaceae bacterium]
PVPVIVEAAHLAHTRLGVAAEAAFTESIAREQQFTINPKPTTWGSAATTRQRFLQMDQGSLSYLGLASDPS